MKMKNCLSVLFSLMLLFGLGSCSSEEGKESVTRVRDKFCSKERELV